MRPAPRVAGSSISTSDRASDTPERVTFGPTAARRTVRIIKGDDDRSVVVKPFSRIVVPLDGSESSARAAPVAAALGQQIGVPISLVAVAVHENHVDTAARVLRHAACHFDQQPIECDVEVGLPAADALLGYLSAKAAPLVVMSTHARTAVGELLLGSTADELVRRSPVPIVLVGPHVELPAPRSTYREIIACLDNSDESQLLLPVVTSLSRFGVHTWLFQVVSDSGVPSTVPEGDVLEANVVRRTGEQLRLAGTAVDWDVGHDDDRARAILRFAASRDAPIVALATHGRHPVDRLSASSVTVTVARSSPCPVLVIGPSYEDTALGAK